MALQWTDKVNGDLIAPGDINSLAHAIQDDETTIGKIISDIAAPFDAENAYTAGDYTLYNGVLYRFTDTHVQGEPWDSTIVVAVLGADEISATRGMMAYVYDPDGDYAEGEFCIYENALYCAKQDIEADGSFKPAHWTATTLAAAIAAVTPIERTYTNASTLVINFPSAVHYEMVIHLTTDAYDEINITMPDAVGYIGQPPAFGNGEEWEISVKDGVVVAGKVVTPT